MSKKIFISDCEGPLTLNDNAFEICSEFIQDGNKFFKILSNYDDYLVDIVKKEDYNAGNTLKFIIPFLKAENITNQDLINFSKNNIFIVNDAKKTLSYIKNTMDSFIVSTSYTQYIQAVCDYFNFSFENTFYTFIDIDGFKLNDYEIKKLKKIKDIIITLDLDKKEDIKCLDKIFFEIFPKMSFYEYYSKIETTGGSGKEKAIYKILSRYDDNTEVFYIGDSITDVEPLKFVKNNNGISVSFNGNIYSLNAAEIAIISSSTLPTAILSNIFYNYDKNEVINFINDYNKSSSIKNLANKYNLNSKISKDFIELLNSGKKPIIDIINEDNKEKLLNNSSKMRDGIRGKDIGNLG